MWTFLKCDFIFGQKCALFSLKNDGTVMIIKRDIQNELISLSKQYPVITVMGPRQSGKTTLTKNAFPNYEYFNLENPDIRAMVQDDPRGFLDKNTKMILDEIQKVPELLSYIQSIVDQKKLHGQFILTGSHNFLLMKSVSQSLAGRTALLQLLPLNFSELKKMSKKHLNTNDYLLNGFFPRIHAESLNPYKAYNNYFETYIQKDLRDLMQVKDIMLFQKFVRLCSGRIGQIFNANELSNEIGVSAHTIKSWLSILQESFIVFLLPPYYSNVGKRLIKSPKIFFYDTGLACYLLGIETITQVSRDPLRGNLFENLVIAEILKHRFNQGKNSNLYFYRDKNKNEVDLLYQLGHEFASIEIKSSQTYNKSFSKSLSYIKELMPRQITESFLVYSGQMEGKINKISVTNYKNIISKLKKLENNLH